MPALWHIKSPANHPLFNSLYRLVTKKTSKLSCALLALYEGTPLVTFGYHSQKTAVRRALPCQGVILRNNNDVWEKANWGYVSKRTWWRHQMETFSALLAICAENSPVPGEFPAQRSVTRSFDVFFDLRLNKRLSKQSWGWWFETLSRQLWRHRNVPTKDGYFVEASMCLV